MKLRVVATVLASIIVLAGCPNAMDPESTDVADSPTAEPTVSSDASLSTLSIGDISITPSFAAETTAYTGSVPYLVTSVAVAASPSHSQAVIESGTGTFDLEVGNNTVDVVVQAEDGTSKTYSIVITREPAIARTFRARTATDSTWYSVPSTLLGESEHALVFVENTQGVSIPLAQSIANEFDANIYDLVRDNFAHEPDVDGNGKIILLLLDIVDGFTGTGGYVAGYFDPTHLFSPGTYANSNEAEMLFMDVNPAVAGSSGFFSTVAHEMQHLVNYNATVLSDGSAQDLWINEGLSSGAEYLYGNGHVASRIDYYNAEGGGTVAYGNNFFVWNGYWEAEHGDVLANYSTVYLFFQWLRIHASNDSAIYKDILSSSFRDHRAVVNAASSRISSGLSSWESILGTWLQANLLGDGSGLKGYAGELWTAPWSLNNTGGVSVALSSGEGIAVATAAGSYSHPSGSGSSIRYNGINMNTSAVDLTGPTYYGDLILSFNSNTNIAGADQTAILPSVEANSDYGNLAPSVVGSSSASLPSVYPVDIQFQPGGGFAADSHRPSDLRNTPTLSTRRVDR